MCPSSLALSVRPSVPCTPAHPHPHCQVCYRTLWCLFEWTGHHLGSIKAAVTAATTTDDAQQQDEGRKWGSTAPSPSLLSPASLCLALKVLPLFSGPPYPVLSDQLLLPPDNNAFGLFSSMPFTHKGLLPRNAHPDPVWHTLQSQFKSHHCGAPLTSCPYCVRVHSPANRCWLSSSLLLFL